MASQDLAQPAPKEASTLQAAAHGSILSQLGRDGATGVFDRTKHIPPRLNARGLNIDPRGPTGNALKAQQAPNILAGDANEKIPEWWKRSDKSNVNTSKTEMVERRRANLKPDMSYDLDGDGVVGNRDYVLAKLFDKDQDGKLNEQERKNAEEAIRNVSYFPLDKF